MSAYTEDNSAIYSLKHEVHIYIHHDLLLTQAELISRASAFMVNKDGRSIEIDWVTCGSDVIIDKNEIIAFAIKMGYKPTFGRRKITFRLVI